MTVMDRVLGPTETVSCDWIIDTRDNTTPDAEWRPYARGGEVAARVLYDRAVADPALTAWDWRLRSVEVTEIVRSERTRLH